MSKSIKMEKNRMGEDTFIVVKNESGIEYLENNLPNIDYNTYLEGKTDKNGNTLIPLSFEHDKHGWNWEKRGLICIVEKSLEKQVFEIVNKHMNKE